jgi:septal ring factor EnvC (AmiA/AmiB activator)
VTPIQLAAVCSLSIAIVPTAGLIYTFRALRRSRQNSAAQSSELAQVTAKLSETENELTDLREKHKQSEAELAVVKPDLANTQGKLKRFRDFIDSLEPLFLQLARDAGDGRGRTEFWRKTAIDFLAELKEQDAAKKAEATLDFFLTAADTAVSHVIPHPSPIGCF